MSSAAKVLTIAASIALPILVCGFAPGITQSNGAVIGTEIIVTAAPAYEPLAALRGGERFPKSAQLLLVYAGKAEPLVAGFAASSDANISFDGKTVLFTGKRTVSDSWQIWELTLADRSARKLIAPTATTVDKLIVHCSSGRAQTLEKLDVDRVLTVEEPK
ncbi:MAG TPA: hypothetical protein VMQ76_10185 [Terracidiphilus sp.]|jgi:hypothetical protein|nr:hypothetical protein [Terracidiphilus sp.]